MNYSSFDNRNLLELKKKALWIPVWVLLPLFVFVLLMGGCTEKKLARPKNPRELELLKNSTRKTDTGEPESTVESEEDTEPEAVVDATLREEEPTEEATIETEPEVTGLEARNDLPFIDLPYESPDGTFVVLEGAYGPQREDYTELIDWIRAMQAPITTELEGPFAAYVFLDEQIAAIYDVSVPGQRRLVHAFPVSSGQYAGNTPLGPTQIGEKHEVGLMFDGSWGLYTSQLNGPVLFHSIPSYGANAHEGVAAEYTNNIGKACSHGCVRLMANASLFIYLYVPTGSQAFVLQNAADFPEIPQDLEALKVPEDGPQWDPTNPNPDNPYLQNPELLLPANQ